MIVSHHPPTQYDRTFTIGKVRFCVRCTSILIGTFFAAIVFSFVVAPLWLYVAISILFPLPGVFNFTRNELGLIRNRNYKRIVTGFLLGIPLGICLLDLFQGHFVSSILVVLWYITLEFVIAIILHRAKVFDGFIKQYEDGVYRDCCGK